MSGKVSKIISIVVIILILAAGCGAIVFFTNGLTSDFKTFYLESNGKPILTDVDEYEMQPDNLNRFDVKYTFSTLSNEVSGYSVKILPNVTDENDFDFTVDGDLYTFGDETDLTKGFDIVCHDDYFTIDGDFTIQSVLEKCYPGKVIVVDTTATETITDLFLLQVMSYNEEAIITIAFHNRTTVSGVRLPAELKF